ncbi:cytoskeletal protein binding protein, partial [Coemansia sp. RSA 2598]
DSDNVPLQMLQMRQGPSDASALHSVPPVPKVSQSPAQQIQAPAAGPDMSKVRTWTDGSGAYTVEAQYLDIDAKGNVHLHKTNGKIITVPLAKFSAEDKRYVDGMQGKAPDMPAKSKTARQRQQENAKKNPGKRIINYDWDWFDFFTLEAGISADNALKYATSFVAERLDNESIPEITPELTRSLGVKPADVMRMQRAFRIHQGLPVEAVDPLNDEDSLGQRKPQPVEPMQPLQPTQPPQTTQPALPVFVEARPQREATRSPAVARAASPTAASVQKSTPPPHRPSNNPWGIDSELDRRFERRKQIETDEALARKLQEEENGKRSSRGRKQASSHKPSHGSSSLNVQKPDPFTKLDGPGRSSNDQRHGSMQSSNQQPLNLGAGSRKPAKSPSSVVDPAQLRSAQQRLGSPLGGASSSLSPVGGSGVNAGQPRSATRNAFDEAFGTMSTASQQQAPQSQPLVSSPPPRARPTARQQPPLSSSSQAAAISGLGELTTKHMEDAAASGNTAQINRLEQMAAAKAQELAAQEARIKQQQEEIRKQAMFLQQQQQQLLQLQQTQKVEAQLKQLKEEKER